jgi:hypothetical protein
MSFGPYSLAFAFRARRVLKHKRSFPTVVRSKGMANCAYARSAICKGAHNCAIVVFLTYYHQIEMFPLYFLKYVDVVYLNMLRVNLMMKL